MFSGAGPVLVGAFCWFVGFFLMKKSKELQSHSGSVLVEWSALHKGLTQLHIVKWRRVIPQPLPLTAAVERLFFFC